MVDHLLKKVEAKLGAIGKFYMNVIWPQLKPKAAEQQTKTQTHSVKVEVIGQMHFISFSSVFHILLTLRVALFSSSAQDMLVILLRITHFFLPLDLTLNFLPLPYVAFFGKKSL